MVYNESKRNFVQRKGYSYMKLRITKDYVLALLAVPALVLSVGSAPVFAEGLSVKDGANSARGKDQSGGWLRRQDRYISNNYERAPLHYWCCIGDYADYWRYSLYDVAGRPDSRAECEEHDSLFDCWYCCGASRLCCG